MSSSKKTPSALASGHGIATLSGATVLDVWFPAPSLGALTGQPDQSLFSVAVTGTNGKTTTCNMISRIAGAESLFVGMASTTGVYFDGKLDSKYAIKFWDSYNFFVIRFPLARTSYHFF